MKASAQPNAQAFYRFKTQDTVIEQIQSALEYGEALVTVTGPDGVGKSQIARIIKRIFSDENFHIVSFNNEVTTEQQLYERISKVVGTVKEDNFVSGLQKLLSSDSNNNKQLLIISDDTDRLAPGILNALRILSNLQADTTRLIQLVLFGSCQLNQVLGQPDYFGFLQRVTHTFYLQPLTEVHIQDSVATNAFNFSLEPLAAKHLASITQGLPSIIVLFFNVLNQLNQKGTTYSKQDIKNIAATDEGIIAAKKRLTSSFRKPIPIFTGALVLGAVVWFMATPDIEEPAKDPFSDQQLSQKKIELANSTKQSNPSTKSASTEERIKANETNEQLTQSLKAGGTLDNPPIATTDQVETSAQVKQEQVNQVAQNNDEPLQENVENAQALGLASHDELQQQLAEKKQIEAEIAQLEQKRKALLAVNERDRKAFKTSEAVAKIAQSYQQQLSDPKSAIESSDLAIRIATDYWANAWSTQSVGDYIDSYIANYTMHDGWPRETWVRLRKQRIEAPEWIKVRISDFKIISSGSEYYQAKFWLHYQSPGYSDHTLKLLTFKMEDSGWKISNEKNLKVVRD
jgi:MSHA biogenesis protein MshM